MDLARSSALLAVRVAVVWPCRLSVYVCARSRFRGSGFVCRTAVSGPSCKCKNYVFPADFRVLVCLKAPGALQREPCPNSVTTRLHGDRRQKRSCQFNEMDHNVNASEKHINRVNRTNIIQYVVLTNQIHEC